LTNGCKTEFEVAPSNANEDRHTLRLALRGGHDVAVWHVIALGRVKLAKLNDQSQHDTPIVM